MEKLHFLHTFIRIFRLRGYSLITSMSYLEKARCWYEAETQTSLPAILERKLV